MVIFNSYVKLPEGKTPRSMEKGTMIFPKISSCQGYDSILQDSLYPIIQYWLGDYAIFHELGNYSNQIQPVFHRMTDSNAAQFSNNQVWWAQTPLPKISSQSISGRLKFCCETYFRGFTFLGMFWHFRLFSELESMRILGMLRNCVCLTGSCGYFADNAVKWLNILLTTCSLNT